METPIQKAIKMCDTLISEMEIKSRVNYEDSLPRMECLNEVRRMLDKLISDEKEMINQIYSNCEKIKAQ